MQSLESHNYVKLWYCKIFGEENVPLFCFCGTSPKRDSIHDKLSYCHSTKIK